MRKVLLLVSALMLPAAGLTDETDPLPRFIVHLETGQAWDPALPPAAQDQFDAHSANMQRLRDAGTILFGARYGAYGLLILEGESLQVVSDVLAADPGVRAGIFDFRIEPVSIFFPWQTAP